VGKDEGVVRSGLKLGIAAAVVVIVVVALGAADLLPSLSNPFASEREQRDSPAILQALEDVSAYTASTANLQASFEIEDETVLPDFLLGQTVRFEAHGSVDGVVDFTSLTEDAIVIAGDRVTITLPEPEATNVRVDPDESRVVDVDRGVLNRLGDIFTDDAVNESDLYGIAEDRLVDAAAETELLEQARANTDTFLTALLGELGYKDVVVRFETPTDTST
jgi:Protein of unknown function (DUF4230)